METSVSGPNPTGDSKFFIVVSNARGGSVTITFGDKNKADDAKSFFQRAIDDGAEVTFSPAKPRGAPQQG
jgi:uncharacterized glyoxalase superfamily protein PhnB